MKVYLRQIPQGETLHIEDGADPAFLELEAADIHPVTPLNYSLDVGISDGGLFAAGRLDVRVRMRCVACLEDFETEIVIDPFAMQKELDGREEVDLSPEIREDIHLALPAHPRCDMDGRKTCPASFPQAPTDVPTSSGDNAAWNALDKLKTDT